MSTVTVPQVNPNDEVTALSVNQGPNAIAAVLNGNVDDANVSTISGSKITSGTLPVSAFDASSSPETREYETQGDFVVSGLIWSQITGLNGTMTSGTAYVNGKRLTPASIATYAFTASRDTYVYLDNTGAVQYSPQTNGAAQPATAANSIPVAIVITNASAITSVVDIRPTASVMAYRQITANFTTTSTSFVQVTGLSANVLVPSGGRRLKITVYSDNLAASAAANNYVSLWDGAVVSGTQIGQMENYSTTPNGGPSGVLLCAVVNAAAGSKTYNVGVRTTTGTLNLVAAPTFPAYIMVENA